jgi:hypothetical protein
MEDFRRAQQRQSRNDSVSMHPPTPCTCRRETWRGSGT